MDIKGKQKELELEFEVAKGQLEPKIKDKTVIKHIFKKFRNYTMNQLNHLNELWNLSYASAQLKLI